MIHHVADVTSKDGKYDIITRVQMQCIITNSYYPPFASIAKGEVFVLLYVFLFVRPTISQQPASRFTPYFACGRSLGRDVSSPLLGVGGPRRAEKETNEIFVTMESMWNFLHFGGF